MFAHLIMIKCKPELYRFSNLDNELLKYLMQFSIEGLLGVLFLDMKSSVSMEAQVIKEYYGVLYFINTYC